MAKEKHIRSVAKGISWRILASLTTMGLVFVFTGNFKIMFEVGVLEFIFKFLIYYFHERAWNIVKWGVDDSK